MPYVALDLGCHTARARTAGGRAVVLPSGGGREGASPLPRGVVADVPAATRLVRTLLRRLRRFPLGSWRAVVCVPGSASARERAALATAVAAAGVQVLAVVPEPLAAALGSGVHVGADWAQLVVDVGHGLTDAGVLRAGRLIEASAPGPGCSDVHSAIAAAVERRGGVRLPQAAAEALCRQLPRLRAGAPASLRLEDPGPGVAGRTAAVPGAVVVAAADRAMDEIVAHVARFVARLAPQAGCEVIESGIVLSGGGALLDGLAERLADATGIAVRTAAEPLPAVLHGACDVLATLRARRLPGRFALDRELG